MKTILSLLLWISVFLILISASNYLLLQNVYFDSYSVLDIVLANLTLLTFITVAINLINNATTNKSRLKSLCLLPYILLFIIIFFALSEVIIYKFSGVGFNEQTFLHLEPESLIIAFKMNSFTYSVVITAIIIVSFLLVRLPLIRYSNRTAWALIFLSMLVFYFTAKGSAIGRFSTGYYQFSHYVNMISLSAEEVEPYKALGIQPIYNDISSLHSEFKAQPKNLIVIYLESFSHIFSTSPHHPNLTPHINQLKKTYGELENYYSTANITIQGIISSQCGLIPELMSGNNIGTDQIQYQNLPCLPNILHTLDYHQEFMGGAKKHFANKALYLESMQFDKIWGWYDYDMPKNYQANSWGLQDGDLFNKAIQRVAELNNSDKPFHLSLLTISTHLNGNPDPNCPKYTDSTVNDAFLDGIYCTDFVLGRFIENLKTQGVLDNTTVFITGDHGVFPVDLVKNLFGTEFNRNKLLGILINGMDFDKTLPLGLYDMAPMLLDSLEIKTNSNFINGLSPRKIKTDRFILRENRLTPKSQLHEGCNKTKPIKPPIDACENQRLLKKSWAHASTFTPKTVWNKDFDPKVYIKSTQEKQQAQLIINGINQSPLFLIDGFPITSQKRKYNHHIFLLAYNRSTNKVLERSAYKFTPMYNYNAEYMHKALTRYHNNKDVTLFIFTEGGQQQSAIAEWNAVFKEIGSQQFDFPKNSYIGIIRFKNEKLQLTEWSQKNGAPLELTLDNINQIESIKQP